MIHDREEAWPGIPYESWRGTQTTLQLWAQIVGKVQLACTPWLNHSWHVTLEVSPRGLRSKLIPHGSKAFDLEIDLIGEALYIRTSDGGVALVALAARPIADFYRETMKALARMGVATEIDGAPNEMADAVPFAKDDAPREFDPDAARRFHKALLQANRLLGEFRTSFLGKSSPVQFFWGGFDLAVTRFSGRKAPPHPVGFPHMPDAVVLDAYSHEVSSAGFWPGGTGQEAAFYSYAYPEPDGFKDAKVEAPARYEPTLAEFLLPYEAVRAADDPDAKVLAFLQTTYASAAHLGRWDRSDLECEIGLPRVVRHA
jgi:hypothetical protein